MNKTVSIIILLGGNLLIGIVSMLACVYLWSDSNRENDSNYVIVLTAGTGFAATLTTLWKMVSDVHRDINSRMTEFLDEARKASRAEGIVEGQTVERANPFVSAPGAAPVAVSIVPDAANPVPVVDVSPPPPDET